MATIIELQIAKSEKEALITALPLIQNLLISNPVKAVMLCEAARTALEKLKSDHFEFSAAELDAISTSMDAAITLCAGQSDGFFDLRTPILEWQRKLAPHYFSLRKLAPILGEAADEILR